MSIWSVTPFRFQLQPLTVYGVHSTPCCFCLRHSGLGVVCQVYISPFPIHSAEYMGIGYIASPLLQVTLFVEIQSGIRWRAVVGLVRWYIARQTQALVGAFCVDALGILAERHPIVQLAAFIYICNKPNHGSASRRHASTICTRVLPTALGHINQTVSSFLPLFNMQEKPFLDLKIDYYGESRIALWFNRTAPFCQPDIWYGQVTVWLVSSMFSSTLTAWEAVF